MMGGKWRRRIRGTTMLEELLAVAVIATVVVATMDVMMRMSLLNRRIEVETYARGLAMRRLCSFWSQPVESITNAPVSWTTNAYFGSSPVQCDVVSVVDSNKVVFTARSAFSVVDETYTNSFQATRIF